MNTVGKITEDIINRSPFLRESLTDNLVNVSALARKIKPEIEDLLNKEVKEGAIIMAIKRMNPSYYAKINLKIQHFMSTLGDFMVRSDLEDFTYENSATLNKHQSEMMRILGEQEDYFYTFCHGVGESTIITSSSIAPQLKEVFSKEKLKSHSTNLASITIKLPDNNTEISGVYYIFLKHLAWDGINIVEMVSTANEFTVVVEDKDVDAAFSVLLRLKQEAKR